VEVRVARMRQSEKQRKEHFFLLSFWSSSLSRGFGWRASKERNQTAASRRPAVAPEEEEVEQ